MLVWPWFVYFSLLSSKVKQFVRMNFLTLCIGYLPWSKPYPTVYSGQALYNNPLAVFKNEKRWGKSMAETRPSFSCLCASLIVLLICKCWRFNYFLGDFWVGTHYTLKTFELSMPVLLFEQPLHIKQGWMSCLTPANRILLEHRSLNQVLLAEGDNSKPLIGLHGRKADFW